MSTEKDTVMDSSGENNAAEEIQENKKDAKEVTVQNPTPIVRVPVKHSNLGIRSHAMYEK